MSRILIVDDDRTTIKLLQTLLQLDGFEVSVTPRGKEAIQLAADFQPDALLVDYHLSDMDGVALVQALRRVPGLEATPVVVTSGLDVEREALAVGASEFLLKPFDPDYLGRLFHRLTADSR